ncbi:TetR/AcrR family transcriptional regulator [Pseudonocardia sp. TRM90224]|uniref:TetR/AcrR family transcriptional regulator n=1 Tax=Pseudonocardia sp. TRM90224 TaxID=2812678 RepID=UPI001E59190F|nr:TetR/AcrR family transcriptional regulator [Pseudonocardia sp. TRM90224]
MPTTKGDWLDCGLGILAEQGAQALRLDRLLATIGLTKGSFYHHFDGMPDYRAELAAYFEERYTTRYIDVATERFEDPAGQLRTLRSLVAAEKGAEAELEVAFRAWAQQDAVVRTVQERIDERRVRFLEELFARHDLPSGRARVLAQAVYLTLVGGGHVVPRAPIEEIERIWDLLLEPLGRP